MKSYERLTKIEKIHTRGGWLRVGDLVSHHWDALSASRQIEGEIVDIKGGKVAIQDTDGVLWVYALHMSIDDVVLSVRG